MDIALYLGLGLLLALILAVTFSGPLLTIIGKILVLRRLFGIQSTLGLVTRQIELSNGVSTWILERSCDGPTNGPPLVVLPGATLNMVLMGIRLEKLITAMPQRRILIVELPHHGRNASLDLDFSKQATSMTQMAEHLEHLRTALGLEDPIDLMGYSLGGGVATQYAVAHPERIRRLLLLAPYFYETATDAFNAKFDNKEWRDIHGWESFDEMQHFFNHWLGLKPADSPPEFIMRGIHKLRSEAYPSGYWSAFFKTVDDAQGVGRTFLQDHALALAKIRHPTLVLAADEDIICDPKKLTRLEDLIGSDACSVQQVPCGHFFGEKGTTLCDIGHPHILQFFTEERSD